MNNRHLAGPILALTALGLTCVCHAQNPLVGEWEGSMASVPTRLQYKPGGAATATLVGHKPRYVIHMTYKVKGDTVQQTTVGQTVGSRTVRLPARNRGTQTYRFRIAGPDTLTFQRTDGFSATLKRVVEKAAGAQRTNAPTAKR